MKPALGTKGTLSLPRGRSASVRVDDHGPGWIELELLDVAMPVFNADSRVSFEFLGAEGRGRLEGRLRRTPHPGILRFTPIASARVVRRAEHFRTAVSVELTVMRLGSPDAVARRALAVQVSGTGMVLRGIPYASSGQLYRFELPLGPSEGLIDGQFRVHHVEGDHVHVVFTALRATDQARLVRYAAARGVGAGRVA